MKLFIVNRFISIFHIVSKSKQHYLGDSEAVWKLPSSNMAISIGRNLLLFYLNSMYKGKGHQ